MNFKRIGIGITLFFAFIAQASAAAQKPRLVVFIAVDQFRSDYLTRFNHQFLSDGYRFFTDKGAYYPAAQTGHGTNVTAAGHATMSTGAYPYTHGIISNNWWDRERHRVTYALEDMDAPLVTELSAPKENGRSPKHLLSTTISDEIKTAFGGKPIVASLSIKDRAAILLGGHRADLALWFDDKTQGWTSSTYYFPSKTLPEWVQAWNRSGWVAKHVPKTWTRLLPKAAYAFSTPLPPEISQSAYENYHGLGSQFPHPIDPRNGAFIGTPWGTDYLLDTAVEAVRKLGMGRGAVPDFLAVSISSFDVAGHAYGPDSEEMQDFTLRQDRSLSRFLKNLKAALPHGLDGVVFVLTADHGMTEAPDVAQTIKEPITKLSPNVFIEKINAYLKQTFDLSANSKPVLYYHENNLYLNDTVFADKKLQLPDVAQKLARWLAEQPCIGFAYSKWDIEDGHANLHFVNRLAVSVHPARSGDVVYTPGPDCAQFDHYDSEAAEHGNVYAHDAALPIILEGAPFKAGRYYEPATLADIAPTLAAAVGTVPPTGSEGRVLSEALSKK